MMKNILLFAGTTEGRLLAEYLIHQPVSLHVCVATEYGEKLLPSSTIHDRFISPHGRS